MRLVTAPVTAPPLLPALDHGTGGLMSTQARRIARLGAVQGLVVAPGCRTMMAPVTAPVLLPALDHGTGGLMSTQAGRIAPLGAVQGLVVAR